jgi:hypothetical protein
LSALGYGGASEGDPAAASPRDLHAPAQLWWPGVVVRGREETRLDLALVTGASLSGRVLDASGHALAGARVEAERRARIAVADEMPSVVLTDGALAVETDEDGHELVARASTSTRSDESGAYELGALPSGRLRIVARDPSRPGLRPAEAEVELAAGTERHAFDLLLGAGLGLAGQVLDEAGRPVEGAEVTVLPGAGGTVVLDEGVATGPDGRFAFQGLEPGELKLYVTAPGHGAEVMTGEPGGPALTVTLSTTPSIEGRVLDATSGRPVTVFRIEVEGDALVMTSTWSDAQGHFSFEAPGSGPCQLTIEAEGYQPASLTVSPAVGGPPLNVLLTPEG